MKKLLLISVFSVISLFGLFAQNDSTALLLIDIQDFYFPGGFSELYQPEQAANNASAVLEYFRGQKMSVIHVRHKTSAQMEIHSSVSPARDEKIITKTEVNSFKDTSLKAYLDSLGATNLVIAGMMTHMCVEAATRAAADYNYSVTLIQDACTTKDLVFENDTVKAMDVHKSTLATLKSYAKVKSAQEFLQGK